MAKKNSPVLFQFIPILAAKTIAIIIILLCTYLLFFHKIKITPKDLNLEFITFTDSEDTGLECSKVESFKRNNIQAQLSYTIGDTLDFPYIGFAIRPKDKRKWNCNLFDRVHITVDPKQTNNFTLLLLTYVDGFSAPEQNISWRIFEKDFTINSDGKFNLPLDHFITPIWWFGSNKIQENGDRSSLSTMGEIHVQSHPLSPKNTTLRLAFKELSFSHSIKQLSPFITIGIVLWLLSFWLQNRFSVKTPFYKPLEVSDSSKEDSETLIKYLAKEYPRLDLTLSKTSIETGIPEKQIRTIMKSFHRKSFKEYLTIIRMEEAKRLLMESDRNISEISQLIGYKHPTTFTRIFRENVGTSPKIFRDQNI